MISGNSGAGVHISGPGASGNQVQGNFIGTDPTGERAVPNGADGVLIDGSSNNMIGGTEIGASKRQDLGQQRCRRSPRSRADELVLGNFIGTDATGKLAVPNGADGVLIGESSNNTIGGTVPRAGNVISGNMGAGVRFDLGARNNVVTGQPDLGQ